MAGEDKTKDELIKELKELRQRITELEASETEGERAEESLRKSEKQASAAIEAARGLTFSYDIVTGKIEWGGAIEEITGYTPKEFANVDIDCWAERIHPNDRDEVLSILQEAVQEKDRATAEYRFKTKKGYVTLASISITEKDEEGKAVRLVGILQDITESKQVEEALRESEKRYRSLFESMLNAFAYCKILVDEDNQPIDFVHLEVNDAWERSVGIKKEDIIGKKITEVMPGIKESKTDLINIYGKVALTGEEIKFDLYFEPLEKWFTISVYSPQKTYFVTVFENITERKHAEEERERLLAELETKNRELESFVYTVSHDLKAPLVSLDGFSSALQKQFYDQLDEKGRHYLERLKANVAHMDTLIMHLLELSRIGKVVEPIEEIDVSALLREIKKDLSVKLKKVKAEFVVQEPLPVILTDRGRIRQVFVNLIDNTVKFRSEERPLRIEVGCQEERGFYRFHVADNGIGIASQYQEQIFAPFQKLNVETEGVGIGLTLVKKIVEHHGGRVWVECPSPSLRTGEEGEGATFYFTLPRKRS